MHLVADVCIVGAGPGGALLGYLLAKENISTIVLERNEGTYKSFRGEHLNDEGEHMLKKNHLLDKVEKSKLLLMKRVEYWENGKAVKSILPSPGHQHTGIHIPQNYLLDVIIKEAQAFKHFQLLNGTTAAELIQDKNGFFTGIKAKRLGEEIIINSSIIVAADGRYSTVRRLANIPTTIIKHGYDLLWAKIPAPNQWEPIIKMASVNGHQLALFTQTGGYIQIGWNIKEGSFPVLRKHSFAPFIQQLVDAFPELNEVVNKHIQSWKDFVLLQVQSCRCETWVKDGVILMGDAAHTMTPTGALGLNCALKDADVLSNIIKKALFKKENTFSYLKKFEDMRRNDIEEKQEQQIKQEQSFMQNYVSFK